MIISKKKYAKHYRCPFSVRRWGLYFIEARFVLFRRSTYIF